MRRSEQSHAQPGRAINAFQHGASRAFAVGAGDVDEPEFFLRIASERGKFARGLHSEICAEQIQAVEKLDGFGVGHGEIYEPIIVRRQTSNRKSFCR